MLLEDDHHAILPGEFAFLDLLLFDFLFRRKVELAVVGGKLSLKIEVLFVVAPELFIRGDQLLDELFDVFLHACLQRRVCLTQARQRVNSIRRSKIDAISYIYLHLGRSNIEWLQACRRVVAVALVMGNTESRNGTTSGAVFGERQHGHGLGDMFTEQGGVAGDPIAEEHGTRRNHGRGAIGCHDDIIG